MKRKQFKIPLLPIAGLIACSGLLFAAPCLGQPPLAPDSAQQLLNDPVVRAWGQNSEVMQCGLCHYSPGNVFAQRNTEFCQLTEVHTWLQGDKHAISGQRVEPLNEEQLQARKNQQVEGSAAGQAGSPIDWLGASNLLSYEMCRKLGYDLETPQGYVLFRDNCLTCHAGYDPQTAAGSFPGLGQDRPGVSCNYCHQIGTNRQWIDQHSGFGGNQSWRVLSPQLKAEAGMRDLVEPRVRADLCASCHVGSHPEGKFITHEMYVAGHPPLPGWELEKFESSMPPHWRGYRQTYASLASYPEREQYFKLNANLAADRLEQGYGEVFWETRNVLLGAIEAAKSANALVAEAGENWGDYALYDCAACHHELRTPSYRQQRQPIGAVGRPRLLEWPSPLLGATLRIADPTHAVMNSRQALHKAISQTPFGNPRTCIPAANQLNSDLADFGAKVSAMPIHAEQARQILRELVSTPASELIDYQAARQVIWAIQIVDQELAAAGQALDSAVRNLIQQLGTRDKQELISTQLPSGRKGTLLEPMNGQSFLAAELDRIQRYDPRIIQKQLAELALRLR